MTEPTWHAHTWIQHLGLCGCPGTQKGNLYVQYYQILMIRLSAQQLLGTVSLQCPLIFLFVSFLIPCLCLVMEVPSQYSGMCQKGMGFFLPSPTSLKSPESHTFFSFFLTRKEGCQMIIHAVLSCTDNILFIVTSAATKLLNLPTERLHFAYHFFDIVSGQYSPGFCCCCCCCCFVLFFPALTRGVGVSSQPDWYRSP